MTWDIGAILTLGIFLVLQLIGAVAWASAMNTKMDFMLSYAKEVKNLEQKFTDATNKFSTKEEVAAALLSQEKALNLALGLADREREAIWKQVDLLKSKA